MNIIEDYITISELSVDISQLEESCYKLRDFIVEHFSNDPDMNVDKTMITKLYKQYNVFLYSFPGFHELFYEIKRSFHEALQKSGRQNYGPYYMGSWLNFYPKDKFIRWHHHWPKQLNTWHGFYCVHAEPSKTTYRLPDNKIIDVESKNGRLVMSPSDGDEHRTWPWPFDNRTRITIAFDIVPWNKIHLKEWPNHWIPI